MSSTPDAVVVDGRLVNVVDHADVYLRPGQVAARLAVAPETVSRWPARYGPDHATPYPTHVDGRHVVVGGVAYVLASALDAWARAVGETSRPPKPRDEGGRWLSGAKA